MVSYLYRVFRLDLNTLDPLNKRKPTSRRIINSIIFHHRGRRFRSILHSLMSLVREYFFQRGIDNVRTKVCNEICSKRAIWCNFFIPLCLKSFLNSVSEKSNEFKLHLKHLWISFSSFYATKLSYVIYNIKVFTQNV